MWPLVREELRILRPVILGAWAICTIGIAVVFAVLAFCGVVSWPQAVRFSAAAWPLYILLASAVPGWIAIGTARSERRLRLHLLLPIPLREIALARLLLPVVLITLTLPVAHAGLALVRLAEGAPFSGPRHVHLALLAAFFVFLHQISFSVTEVYVLRETSRAKALLGSLGLLVVPSAAFAAGLPPRSYAFRIAAVLILALVTGAANLALFLHRRSLAR